MPFLIRIRPFFAAERPRLILWSPAALMLGVASYFQLQDDPPAFAGIVLLAVAGAVFSAAFRSRARIIAWAIFLMALGFFAAQLRAQIVMTPLITSELEFAQIEGSIDEIEPVEARVKIVLSQLSIEGLAAEQTPRRVRVSFRENDVSDLPLRIGDRIRLEGTLFPLPQPAMPGGYDFARHFYFRGIGGSGFAFHPPEIIASQPGGFAQWLGNLRHDIGEDMRAHMPGVTGTVAAAMTVGETGPIPADVKNTLRDAGLAHMLAIAGLHLGIVASIVFFTARLLLAFYPPLALRISPKKIAAVLALISAAIYLSLAGGPIPAQRAFIMVAFLFLAMLLERRGITLRTLALAACLILLAFPEAMFGASFQLSFAATLAIVSFYERFGRTFFRPRARWLGKIMHEITGIAFTSLSATLATAPFILYNFNRFAAFGLIANMIVIPLATFIIMPGIVIALLLMPLGLQAVGYAPLKLGVDLMIAMAAWVTSLPYASIRLPSPTDIGLAACAFGLMWLCVMMTRWRLLGLAAILCGLTTMAFHVAPDMFISSDLRQVMARTDDGQYTMLKGSGRSFVAQSWLRAEGHDEVVPLKETNIDCDRTACDYLHHSHHILLLKKPSDEDALKALCAEKADVLIAWDYVTAANCPTPARLIGRSEIEAGGAYILWLGPESVKILQTREKKDHRLWHP